MLANNRVSRGSQYNSTGKFLLGLVSGGSRILQVPDEYTTRTTQYSFYAGEQWHATRRLTVSYGARIEPFPMPTRADRGVERYDFATSEMMVCGVGGIPADSRTKTGNAYISPRLGIAYRVTDKTVVLVRSGFGINWDPWNVARPLRTNYPSLAVFNVVASFSQSWAMRFDRGLPAIPQPQVGSDGRIPMPLTYSLNTTDDEFKGGYMMNWNVMVQRELPANFNFQPGPGFNADLGLFRSVRMGERFNLQFRAEAFHRTNTPKFNKPERRDSRPSGES